MLQPPRNRKPAGDLVGRSNAPEQISQAPGLREFRLAESQQILPLIGNRKPASDRGHWLQPVPCSSRRRSCPGGEGETGRVQSQWNQPVTGIADRQEDRRVRLQTESFQRPRAEQHTHFREIRNSNFFGAPPLGVGVFGKLPAARKRKDRQRNRLARSQRLRLSREPKARWRPGSADRTAPEQISQAPGLREFRLAESQQILP